MKILIALKTENQPQVEEGTQIVYLNKKLVDKLPSMEITSFEFTEAARKALKQPIRAADTERLARTLDLAVQKQKQKQILKGQ